MPRKFCSRKSASCFRSCHEKACGLRAALATAAKSSSNIADTRRQEAGIHTQASFQLAIDALPNLSQGLFKDSSRTTNKNGRHGPTSLPRTACIDRK